MHPLGYYCDNSVATRLLTEKFGESLEKLEMKEKFDLLYNVVEVLWNRHQPVEIFDEKVMYALLTVQGQSNKDLIKFCKALIEYLEAETLQNSSSVLLEQLPQKENNE